MTDLERVKRDGLALKHMTTQTPEICMEAVKQNGFALQYVKKQTPEICIEAINQNVKVKRYIKIPLTDEMKAEILLQTI